MVFLKKIGMTSVYALVWCAAMACSLTALGMAMNALVMPLEQRTLGAAVVTLLINAAFSGIAILVATPLISILLRLRPDSLLAQAVRH